MNKKTICKLVIFLFLSTILVFTQQEKKISVKTDEEKRWAILIGINDYRDSGIVDLSKARNDAKGLGGVLRTMGNFHYVYEMTDDLDYKKENFPDLSNIRDKLNYLKNQISENDLVLFAFSGHGYSNQEGENFLVVFDSKLNNISETSLSEKEIIDWLKGKKVKKLLLLLDACREKIDKSKSVGSPDSTGFKAKKYEAAEVSATFYATEKGKFSYELEDGDYGVFTNYIIEGLKNCNADKQIEGNKNGIVTFNELARYVEKGVNEWAVKNCKNQFPSTFYYTATRGDLALSSCNRADECEIDLILGNQSFNSKEYPRVTLDFWKVPKNINKSVSVTVRNKSSAAQELILDSQGIVANWSKTKTKNESESNKQEIEANGGGEITMGFWTGTQKEVKGFDIKVNDKSIMLISVKYEPFEEEIPQEQHSGFKDSGFRKEFSQWYELSLGSAPDGYTLIPESAEYWLTGDRQCGSWANCRWISRDDRDVRFAFSLQGHDEGFPFVRQSEGHLKAKYKLIQKPPIIITD